MCGYGKLRQPATRILDGMWQFSIFLIDSLISWLGRGKLSSASNMRCSTPTLTRLGSILRSPISTRTWTSTQRRQPTIVEWLKCAEPIVRNFCSHHLLHLAEIMLSVSEKDVTHYARSACFVARYHLLQGGNDILLAKEYLALVAKSNAEEVGVAAELLKKVDEVLADRARAGATGVGMGPTTDASAHPGPRPPAREASIVV